MTQQTGELTSYSASRKDIRRSNIVAAKAVELKGKELVLLHYEKKSGEVTYERYYLESEISGSDIFNLLIRKQNYLDGKKIVIFLKFSSKTDSFYLSDCFDKILSENEDLKSLLKEIK